MPCACAISLIVGMSQLLTMSPTGDAATDTPGFVESRTLASLRDTLLPALMSGTLRVRDAEKQVEEAL